MQSPFNGLFQEKKGLFGQIYYSAQFQDKEITIDNIYDDRDFRVCICTPFSKRMEKRKSFGGYGEVIKELFFKSIDDAYNFLLKEHVII